MGSDWYLKGDVEERIEKDSCLTCDRQESCAGNDSGIFPCPDFIRMKKDIIKLEGD